MSNDKQSWTPGDTCVVITDKKRKRTAEYTILSFDGKYYHVTSKTGTHHHLSPSRMYISREAALATLKPP